MKPIETLCHLKLLILILFLFACSGADNPSAPSSTNGDYWQLTNGPYGGSISLISAKADGELFAGTRSGSVFRSQNHGESWQRLDVGLAGFVLVIAFDAQSSIYISASGRLGPPRFIKSADGGQSWQDIETGLSGTISELEVSSAGHIVVGSGGGLARSKDNGATWEQLNAPGGRLAKLLFNAKDYLFFGDSGGGLFRSKDLGETWTNVSPASTNPFIRCVVAGPKDETIIGVEGATYIANSEGENWRKIFNSTGYHVAATATGHIFVATDRRFFRSTDAGQTWSALDAKAVSPQYSALLVTPDDNLFVGTSDGRGLLRSKDDGDNFEEKNTGITSAEIRALRVDGSDEVFASITNGRLFYSRDRAATWQLLTPEFPRNVNNLVINSSGTMFAGSASQGISRSVDRGFSWTKIAETDVADLVVDSRDRLYGARRTTGSGVIRSVDGGATWSSMNAGLRAGEVRCLGVDLLNNIYAGTDDGLFFLGKDSTRWVELPNQLKSPFPVSTLAIDSDGDIFAGSENKVFRFDKHEAKWSKTQLDIGNFYVAAIGVFDRRLFVGSVMGVHTSSDKGATWLDVNSGLVNPSIRSIDFDSRGYVYVGNFLGGVFRSSRPGNE